MTESYLQTFLDDGLLDLGEDRDRFDYVEGAARDVATFLKGDRGNLVRAALLLLSGRFLEHSPLTRAIDGAIKQHWQTYRSRFPNLPGQLFRAVLLEATAQVVRDADPAYAAIVLYTASSPLPHLAAARDDALLRRFLTELAQRVEEQARAAWARPSAARLAPEIKPGLQALPLDAKALAAALMPAVGPVSGAANANPEWPSASENWATRFTTSASAAIAAALGAPLSDLAGKLHDELRVVVDSLQNVLDGYSSATSLRTDLLFWKETLFSSGAQVSYRSLQPDLATYWLARDLHTQVPSFHPHCAEYFLRETLRSALGEDASVERRTPQQLFAGISSNAPPSNAKHADAAEVLTILEALEAMGSLGLEPDAVPNRTAVPETAHVSREEWVVWLFRDLQARRFVEGA